MAPKAPPLAILDIGRATRVQSAPAAGDNAPVPSSYAIDQNFPNPFNATTVVRYAIPRATQVTITVHDIVGREVRSPVNDFRQPGYYQVAWDGKDAKGRAVSSGVYLCRFEAGSFVQTRKLAFVR